MKFKEIFDEKRIVALAGDKNSGKTNNIVSWVVDLRKNENETPIYSYGFSNNAQDYLNKLGVREISTLKHMIKKKDCILLLDEFQKLRLNDKRNRDGLNEFVDFVYHNNIYCLLSSANIREFNSIIGSIVERWILKNVNLDSCINGSQLKDAIMRYNGRYKELGSIVIPANKALVINDKVEIIINCEYIKEVDSKKENKPLFL